MKASVIVLSWNGMRFLQNCLSAVMGQDYSDFEVVVVDNGSVDGSADFVAQAFPSVQLIRLPENAGYAAGNNIGMRAAVGDVLVLLNQDTEVHSGWLTALMEALTDSRVGIAGSKMLYPDGTIQHAGGYFADTRGTPAHYGRHEPDHGQYDTPREVPYVAGAAIGLRRRTLARIGPLDEGFSPAYFEDADWCFRARATGLSVLYWPAASLTHFESPAVEHAGYRQKAVYHHGRLRLLLKHKPIDWLKTEFAFAESMWVKALGRTVEMAAARDAYLRVLLTLPEIFAYRTGPCGPAESGAINAAPSAAGAEDAVLEWSSLMQVVMRLRQLTQTKDVLVSGPEPSEQSSVSAEVMLPALLEDLAERWLVEEVPFHSEVPFLGKGIATLRTLWNNVSTRWYVRPLLQQQVAYNATVRDALLVILRELAQTQRELDLLAARLSQCLGSSGSTPSRSESTTFPSSSQPPEVAESGEP